MRSKRAFKNFYMSIILQIVTAISGLIIPRLFIKYYGSEVNGLISSINQFLGFITFFEAGLSGVIMSQLYKPLAEKNNSETNAILANARNFFNKMGLMYIVYVITLSFVYPRVINSNFSNEYVFLLIVILSVSLLFQYLFGIVNNIFLQANQKSYVLSIIQTIVVFANAFIVIICIKLNYGVHLLKSLAVLATIINPLWLYFYVKKVYHIDFSLKGNSKNSKQRWDGVCHHIAYFIQNNIDVMILTFVDLKLVSVYSVYRMITYTLRKLFESFVTSFQSAMGDLLARDEKEQLKKVFSLLEFLICVIATIVFISLAFSILPFIKLYTKGVTDINYNIPIFAFFIVLAEVFYTVRIPYHTIVMSSGHFRQTRKSAIIEAGLNVVMSLLLVHKFGIIGVAIGTCVSCLYGTIYYIIYLHKNILMLLFSRIIKRILMNFGVTVLCTILFRFFNLNAENYVRWFVNGILYATVSSIIVLPINYLMFKSDWKMLMDKVKRVTNRK